MFENESTALATIDELPQQLSVLPTEVTPEVFAARIEREQQLRGVLKNYVRGNMKEGHHFSTKLGTQELAKPMLLQEGCRNICSLLKLFFGEPKITEQWLDGDHYRVRVHISLHNAEGHQITSGDAICSTRETKYAYRMGQRLCPDCNQPTVRKDNKTPGGGWYCWKKEGVSNGCGAKFAANDEAISGQQSGRIDNPDKADVENTVLKMAIKRAKSAAVCDVPMVSEIFAPEDDAPRQQNNSNNQSARTPADPPARQTVSTNKAEPAPPADDPKELTEMRAAIAELLNVKVSEDQAEQAAYLKGRDPAVMTLDALKRMQGDLAAM